MKRWAAAATPNDQELKPGAYSVSESVPAGWDLTSATCDDDDSSDPASLTLDPGETIHCTFTNTKRGKIIVVDAGDSYKHKAKSAMYTITLTAFDASQTVTIKANGFGVVDFDLP